MSDNTVKSIVWQDDHVRLIDQTYLPEKEIYLETDDVKDIWEAIKKLRIRGAPAIGIAAAYGLYLGSKGFSEDSYSKFIKELEELSEYLKGARPTAVNLEWAVDKAVARVKTNKSDKISKLKKVLLDTAKEIHREDRVTCEKIGKEGQVLIEKNANVLTHCNTGGLATAEFGTAFSVILHAHFNKKNIHIWVDETRPLLQGSRLTAWELENAGINYDIIVDSAAASLMLANKVDIIITGADRVAANGDTANKIGTYGLAALANKHDIPFYVAAPLSTIDMNVSSGKEIPIEERSADEIRKLNNTQISPGRASVYNPAFDITPHKLIAGIITEVGIIRPDYQKNIATVMEKDNEDNLRERVLI